MSGIVLALAGRTTGPAPPPPIGSAYGGGYFAGQIGVGGVATHNLVIGPKASAQVLRQYKSSMSPTVGSSSSIDGPANTAAQVAEGDSTVYPAAHFCNDLSTGGETDWYMPAKNEVEVCYFNLKPTTTSNSTVSGINDNAVPSRASNYTSGDPAQTSAVAFQSGSSEAFDASNYWTSTEYASGYGGSQNFSTGGQAYISKTSSVRVRAVRRVAV